MQTELVSVILPAYNASNYIKEAIGSVLEQTYGNFEIIVINDGSTDDTENKLLSIKDGRIRYIKTENSGNYFARNRGIRESRGEYIAFLDTDDIWLGDKLKKQIEVFNKYKDIGFCCTDEYIFFYNDRKKLYINRRNVFSDDILLQNNFIEKLLYENFINTSSVMIKRSCIDRVGKFDTTGRHSMDYEMWLRVALNCRAYYIKDRLVLRRIHEDNISHDRIDSTKTLFYTVNKINANIENNKFFDENQKKIIDKKIELVKYRLGIEYLSLMEYKNALRYLNDSNYPEKGLFRRIAVLIARSRARFLIPFVNLYRLHRRKKQLVAVRKSDVLIGKGIC